MDENILTKKKVKSILEALFFNNEDPIKMEELVQSIEIERKDIEEALEELIADYNQRAGGLCIVKVAGGYQMCSSPENEPWIKRMFQERGKQKLSIAALETLAIIVYKQPITRMEIEEIRGVNIDGVMKHLLNLGLINHGGRKEVIGRPFLYITTRKFLEYFGLNSLKDLPKVENFITLAEENDQKKNIENTDVSEENKIDNVNNPVQDNSNSLVNSPNHEGEI